MLLLQLLLLLPAERRTGVVEDEGGATDGLVGMTPPTPPTGGVGRGMISLGRAPPPCDGVGVVEDEDGIVDDTSPADNLPQLPPTSESSDSESVKDAAGDAGRMVRCGVLCGDLNIPGVRLPP